MNEQEKSLKLAELMGWRTDLRKGLRQRIECTLDYFLPCEWLEPYSKANNGMAQFAAILIKFPEVVCEFVALDGDGAVLETRYSDKEFTQQNILDEILRMNGIDV